MATNEEVVTYGKFGIPIYTTKYRCFDIPDEECNNYITILSYVPNKDKIDEILNKEISCLTMEEIELLRNYKEDMEYVNVFKEWLNCKGEKSNELYDKAHDYRSNSIYSIVNRKFNKEQLEDCASILNGTKKVDILDKYNDNDKNIMLFYIKLKLNDREFKENLRKLAESIREDILKNEEDRHADMLWTLNYGGICK